MALPRCLLFGPDHFASGSKIGPGQAAGTEAAECVRHLYWQGKQDNDATLRSGSL
jgi:hypothetical protein